MYFHSSVASSTDQDCGFPSPNRRAIACAISNGMQTFAYSVYVRVAQDFRNPARPSISAIHRSSGRRLFPIVGIESFAAFYPQTALLDIPLEQLARFSGNTWTDGCVMLFDVKHYI